MSQTHRDHDVLLAEYEFARETLDHNDSVAWEVAAIVWGAQTLLLGFVLEAIEQENSRPLILVVSLLGVLMALFNLRILSVRVQVCRLMSRICSEIENAIPMQIKPQNKLDEAYPSGIQQAWYRYLNNAMAVVWLAVFFTTTVYMWRMR